MKIGLKVSVLMCDGYICVRIGDETFLFEADGDSTGEEAEPVKLEALSPGAREYFGLRS